MIVVKLSGGLGNQLFQYAFGRFLSMKKNTCLGVNLDSYKGNKIDNLNRRVMHLQDFNTKFKIIGSKKIRDYLFLSGNKFIDDYFLLKLKFLHKKAFFGGQDISRLNGVDDVCLIGHFINGNAKYLQEVRAFLEKEIVLKDKSKINKLLKEIKKVNSISIHVRRGDLTKVRNGFVLPKDYYLRAINAIEKDVKNPFYYVFSDDLDWCKKNLSSFKKVKFISGNSVSEDLELMKNCKHNIIANSTLSWWAAYLNKNKKRIIIQPKHMGSFINDLGSNLLFSSSKKL